MTDLSAPPAPSTSLQGEPLSLVVPVTELLAAGLAVHPDQVAVVGVEDRCTWAQLDDRVARLAGAFTELGLQPGDRIASLLPNRVDLVVHYLACFRAGLVMTPLNYRYTRPEVEHALAVSGARTLIVHDERAGELAPVSRLASLDLGVIDHADPGTPSRFAEFLAAGSPLMSAPAPRSGDSPAALFFTSGSTGPAKGVTHTWDSLAFVLSSAAQTLGLRDNERFMPASSLSHIGAVLWAFGTLSVGGSVVVPRTFDAYEVLALLRAHRPTAIAMIPAALTGLLRDHDAQRDDFASVRLCRCGADRVSRELYREFDAICDVPIDEGWGMTEIGLGASNMPTRPVKEGSIGPAAAGVQLQVVHDVAGLPDGVGRVLASSRGMMVGYWDDPAATAQVVQDGWLDTGDLAAADDDGYLWFFGRSKQIIVHDGSNISPKEVEDALAAHPAVALVGVIGVADPVHGARVRAYATIREGAPRPAASELIVFARALVGYKAPEEVVFLDEMPLNPTGKIDRVGLAALAAEHVQTTPGT